MRVTYGIDDEINQIDELWGEYVIDDADHDGAILFRFLSTRFREKAAQSSQGSYVSKPVHLAVYTNVPRSPEGGVRMRDVISRNLVLSPAISCYLLQYRAPHCMR